MAASRPALTVARRGGSVAAAWLCAVVLLGVSAAQAGAGEAIDRIRAGGALTVALFFEDVTPFFFTGETGELDGIDPWLARDIARNLGVEVAWNREAETFDGLIDEVAAGRADVAISLLSDTLERATRVRFTDSYVDVRQFLLINRLELGALMANRPDAAGEIRKVLDEPGSRIGVIRGTSYVDFAAQDFPRAQRIEFDDWSGMLAAVKSGDLTALMYDEIEIGNWRLADPAGALQLRPLLLESRPDTIAMAVRPQDGDLADWLDLYLRKIRADGALPAVLDRYLYTGDRALTNE